MAFEVRCNPIEHLINRRLKSELASLIYGVIVLLQLTIDYDLLFLRCDSQLITINFCKKLILALKVPLAN